MLKLELVGNIPSKKNQRINLRSGISIPSAKFTEWQTDALWQVRQQTRQRIFEPVAIDVTLYFATMRRADLDNRITSILDMLVEGLVLADDDWQHVPQITARAQYRKGEPGATVIITELVPA